MQAQTWCGAGRPVWPGNCGPELGARAPREHRCESPNSSRRSHGCTSGFCGQCSICKFSSDEKTSSAERAGCGRDAAAGHTTKRRTSQSCNGKASSCTGSNDASNDQLAGQDGTTAAKVQTRSPARRCMGRAGSAQEATAAAGAGSSVRVGEFSTSVSSTTQKLQGDLLTRAPFVPWVAVAATPSEWRGAAAEATEVRDGCSCTRS
mmetsp:Transcript_13211/g.21598  ORF Transcript_13211/g.21598 Transcript_13211/m.21598 type:complete len:206 (+) Transcript_13211:532-1149(+)